MNAELLLAHYDRISDAPDAVARLRKFVLDLAVRGKLVEPTQGRLFVSKLIREIKKETAERAEHGAKSPQLQFQEIAREDAPFRVPPSWTWIRFGCLVIGADAGWSPKAENFPRVGENWGVLKVSAVSWNRFLPSENKQLPESRRRKPHRFTKATFSSQERTPASLLQRASWSRLNQRT
jgi:type I restriction enzyme S subunit